MNAHNLNRPEALTHSVHPDGKLPSQGAPQHLTFPGTPPASTPEDEEAARQSTEPDPEQERLQVEADLLRARLASTLESLGQRKQAATQVTQELTHSPLPLALAGAGALVAVAGGGWLLVHHARKRMQPPPLGERLHAAAEVFQHPERAPQAKQRPLAAEIGRALVVSLSSYLLTQLAKQGLKKLAAGTHPSEEAHREP